MTVRAPSAASYRPTGAATTQARVVGALILRELHTRFGRDNIGYLWVIGEPLMLTMAIVILHAGAASKVHPGMLSVPFWITGYVPFIMFRNIVGRAEAALESNKTLLYHRMVTLLDLLIARALLEFVATFSALVVTVGLATLVGYADLPDRPLLMMGGMLLLLWLSFALSMLVMAACEFSVIATRFIHPAIYISLPLSGAFFMVGWLPPGAQAFLAWSPLVTMFDMIHMGQFAAATSKAVSVPYALSWCMGVTVLGLHALRRTRQRIHLN